MASTVDPKKVFETAQGFRHAVRILIEQYKNQDQDDLLAPLCANMAFAAELYMKCLLYRDRVAVPKTHELEKLFQNLGAHRAEIKKLYGKEKAKKSYIPRIEAALPHMQFNVESVLKATNSAFEEWRYFFEDKYKLFYGLAEFCDAINDYILTLEPKWVQ